MRIIKNNEELATLCQDLAQEDFLTIDLEFLREKTYYAKLCLIQVANSQTSAIIDPLSENLELDCFFELLKNQNQTKVFHSGRQDIEILYHLGGFIPTPLFDTQIAAMVCGFGEAVSYETLVNKICGITLDKSSRLSDWSCRPLSETQLEYALSDTTYLVNIYKYFCQYLKQSGRLHWLDEETTILASPQTYQNDPYQMWQKLRHRSHNPHYLTVLRELCAWRELRAQKKNTPRQSLIKDDCLLNIAAVCPTCIEDFDKIRNIHKDIINGKLGREIIDVILACTKIPEKQYVKLPPEIPLSHTSAALYELLKLLLKITAQESGVVAKLIASDDDLKNFSGFIDKDNPILKGWRKELFGNKALALREGRLHIGYDNQHRKIDIRIDNPHL
ncbi:MAG: ribonuclease D [Alphaproteobacteria bacterium]|nr:ribonuclease D [Alphaproteobacteria bacterium]